MLLSPRKKGLTSLFKKVTVFKAHHFLPTEGVLLQKYRDTNGSYTAICSKVSWSGVDVTFLRHGGGKRMGPSNKDFGLANLCLAKDLERGANRALVIPPPLCDYVINSEKLL